MGTLNFSLLHKWLSLTDSSSLLKRFGPAVLNDRGTRMVGIFRDTLREVDLLNQAEKSEGTLSSMTLHAHMKTWADKMNRLLQLEVTGEGIASTGEPVIFVGNHISYVDIPVLMSQVPVVFIAKKSVGSWPVMGSACRRAGILFVERGSKSSRNETGKLVADCILNQRQSIAIFPAGTTAIDEEKPWRWGPFKIAKAHGIKIQPFRIQYSPLKTVAFVGNDTFVPHLWNLLGAKTITASVEFHPVVEVSDPQKDAEHWRHWCRAPH